MALTSTDERKPTTSSSGGGVEHDSEVFMNFTYDEQSAFDGMRDERRR